MSRDQPTHTSFTGRLGRRIPGLYQELRALASRLLSRERVDHTLQPTALVHEAYLRLSRSHELDVADTVHARALAARNMRRVLVDHARRAASQRLEGRARQVPLEEERTPGSDDGHALVDLDDALEVLRARQPRRARVIELRFFAGLSVEETAAELGLSPRTVIYDSRAGCAWLRAEMERGGEG